MWDRDPSFSKELVDAKQAGVDIKCFTTNVTLKEITFCKEIPLNLTPPDEQ
jgi:DNA-binding sugar fermentation-stimulating protein